MESLIVVARPRDGASAGSPEQILGGGSAERISKALREDVSALACAFRDSAMSSDSNRKIVVLAGARGEDDVTAEALLDATGGRMLHTEEPTTGAAILGAVRSEFERGARAVAALYLDTPTLPLHLIDHAFRALCFHDLVLGPCVDGAPYLIGARRPLSPAVEELAWGEPALVTVALRALSAKRLYLMPFWYHLAQPEVHELLRAHQRYLQERRPDQDSATASLLDTYDAG